MRKGKVAALLAALLLLAGCAAVPESASSPAPPTPEEVLCRELRQRGIADYDSSALEPYDGNINGCISYTDWEREWDTGELLVYRIVTGCNQYQGESGPVTIADYDVAAVTKDLQYFFAMSHIDGILYDIRDNAAYIHEGEYTQEEARRELERYLRAETNIDPDGYDITVWAQWIDEAYNYQAALDEKGAAPGAGHAYEFYLSKDLKRIARIDYRQEPGERKEHLGGRFQPDAPAEGPYTAEELKALLLDWLRRGPLPQAEEGDILIELDGTQGPQYRHKVPLYRYRVPLEGDSSYLFDIFADLSYADWFLAAPTEELYPKAYYTYVKDEK